MIGPCELPRSTRSEPAARRSSALAGCGLPGGTTAAPAAFFREARSLGLKTAKLSAFGSTRHFKNAPQDDPNTWVMLEMFRSRAAWDEHMRQPYNTEGTKILEVLLRGPGPEGVVPLLA